MTAFLLLLLAPLFTGSLKWLKARLQNRQGPSPLIDYLNLYKLAQKAYIRPELASPVFILGPVVSLLGVFLAASMVPLLPGIAFPGDFLLVIGLMNLGRFFQALAALDTGSAFGAQGSYRESLVSVLSEPGTVLALAALALSSPTLSLSGPLSLTPQTVIVLILAGVALVLGLIAEGARMPVDDPTTHLELTMIHEAQLLDHSGPLLALYELAAGLKLMLYSALIALLLPLPNLLSFALVTLGVWLLLAYLETYGVRIRYARLPDLLIYSSLAGVLALLGVILRFQI